MVEGEEKYRPASMYRKLEFEELASSLESLLILTLSIQVSLNSNGRLSSSREQEFYHRVSVEYLNNLNVSTCIFSFFSKWTSSSSSSRRLLRDYNQICKQGSCRMRRELSLTVKISVSSSNLTDFRDTRVKAILILLFRHSRMWSIWWSRRARSTM